jgi:AraC-like DNA-binding protein
VPDNIEIVPFALEVNMEQMPELGVRRYDFQPFQECDWHSHDAEAMRKEPDRNMDLEGWAQLVNMSRRTLCRHFLEDTGMSLPEWQRNLRLMLARQYLEEGVSVTQVALSLGYDSPSAFIAMFKRVFGTTPKRFTSISAF